jgi:glycosyltransferase involved in cell wall biosynthesis
MKVMIAAHHLPPDGSAGVERVAESLGQGLVELGDSVTFVTRRVREHGEPRRLREQLPNGATHYRLAGGTRPFEGFLAHHESLEREFTAALVETDPDVLHVHHLFGLSPRFIAMARALSVAVVVSLHDYYFACPLIVLRKRSGEICDGPDGGRECASTCFAGEGEAGLVRWGLRAAYFRSLLQLANRFVAPSHYMASFFERYGVDGRLMRVVENAVVVPSRSRAAPERSTPSQRGCLNLAYLGTVAEHKGVDVVLEALRLAQLGPVSFIVAGDVPVQGYGRRLQAEAGTIPGVDLRLHGRYELGDVPGLLEEIDCVVIPSQWPETFAIVAREAFTRGVPVVAARIGGLPEAIEEGSNGFTFAPDRPDELARILTALAGDAELLRSLRAGARETKVLSSTRHAELVRAVYHEAVADGVLREPVATAHGELAFLHEASVKAGFAAA